MALVAAFLHGWGCSLQDLDPLGAGVRDSGAGGTYTFVGKGGSSGTGAGTTGAGVAGSGGGVGGAQTETGGSGGAGGATANGGTDAAGSGGVRVVPVNDAGAGINLVDDPGFESGISGGWGPWGTLVLSRASDTAAGGDYSLLASGRAASWAGPAYQLMFDVVPGALYQVSAWVRTVDAPEPVLLTLKTLCVGDATSAFGQVASSTVDGTWTLLTGSFYAPVCELRDLQLYVEGPPEGVNLYVDDVAIVGVPPG